MAKKQLTEFTMHCHCGAAAPVFKLRDGRFMGHCSSCGSLTFFSNPLLLERLHHGLPLCPHRPEARPCRSGWTSWCLRCRVRVFGYEEVPPDVNHGA